MPGYYKMHSRHSRHSKRAHKHKSRTHRKKTYRKKTYRRPYKPCRCHRKNKRGGSKCDTKLHANKNHMNKYIIYKGTGGLFHNLSGLTKSINIAIKNKCILIIDMESHLHFGGNFHDYFTINCKELVYKTNYDNIPNNIISNDVRNRPATLFGYKGNNVSYSTNNIVNITYGYQGVIINKDIKVNESTINSIKHRLLSNKKKYIAIHFRNTDIKHDINLYLAKINSVFNSYPNINTLYVATDDPTFYDIVKSRFLNKNIIRSTIPEPNVKNLHFGCKDKVKQQHNCLIDVYNLLVSDVFIPSVNSGFSKTIMLMIKEGFTIFPNTISNSVIMD